VLRHFVADPLLPREIWPRRWPGDALRADYERYDVAYRGVLARWNEVGRTVDATTVEHRERP
jgi:phenylacetic acid degradation operon negative regulatory protein